MAELRITDQLIVSELLDNNVFSSATTGQTTRARVEAVNSLKKPQTQQRIGAYLKNLIGQGPENFQENLVLMFGDRSLDEDMVHVLLATLKAVINLPSLQNNQTEHVIATQMLVRQVRSEVVNLDEKEIQRLITMLFVDRLSLFKSDYMEPLSDEETDTVAEYWDIDPNFNAIAQGIVNQLEMTSSPNILPVQKINRRLLENSFVNRRQLGPLWDVLITNKTEIAAQWAQTGRFILECGDNYALLLDTKRQPSVAKPFVLAIAVAHSLGVGVQEEFLNQRIHEISDQMFPKSTLSISNVKQELFDNQLVRNNHGFIVPTTLSSRFKVGAESEGDN